MLYELAGNFALKQGFCVRRSVSKSKMQQMLRFLAPQASSIELVRLGGAADGGYLVPDDLEGIAACFSPGVDYTATFERDLVDRGIPCFLSDRSVDGSPFDHELVSFQKKFIDVVNDEGNVTLNSWVKDNSAAGQDLLLQMDIEGAEWRVLLDTEIDVLKRFRIIVLELHNIHHAFESSMHDIVTACLTKLNSAFEVVHVHPNNAGGTVEADGLVIPKLIEVTYHRKDRAATTGPARSFPHPLDKPCDPKRADIPLPDCFIG